MYRNLVFISGLTSATQPSPNTKDGNKWKLLEFKNTNFEPSNTKESTSSNLSCSKWLRNQKEHFLKNPILSVEIKFIYVSNI